MTIQPNRRADNGETIRLLSNYSSSSISANVPTSTKATNSLSDPTLSDDNTELESILHDSVNPVPQTNLGPVVLLTQPAPEQFQGFRPHHAVALALPVSAMIVLRTWVRQVLSANTAVSVVCLVLYQALLPTLQMRTRIFLQSTLWAVVPVTHRCLHNGYLPLVLLPSLAMAWIWHETYLGRTASFAVHGAVGEPVPDTCPHGSTACQALFGMVVTTVMSALCFAAEIGLFWYIEHGPRGNMWLQDGDEGLMANFLRGHRHEELVQCLRDAEGHALQDRFATQDQFMTEMFPVAFVAQRPAHAQFVGVGYAQVAPVPVVCASHAFYLDSFSDEETVTNDESFQSSESDDDNDDDIDEATPYLVNIASYAAHIEPFAAQMSVFHPLKSLALEMCSKTVAAPVQPYSVGDNKVESVSDPEIFSPVPRRSRVSPLLYSQLSLTGAAYMPVRSGPHHMVQPQIAASFYREIQFGEIPLSNVASPPAPLPLDAAVPAAVYSYDDPLWSIGSVTLFKKLSDVDQECIRRRLVWAQSMVDKENATVRALLLAIAKSLSDDDEGDDDAEEGVADDEDDSDDDESEDSEEASEEEDEDEENESRSPGLAPTSAQEMEEHQDDWDVLALVAQAHAVQEMLKEDARVLKPFGFYNTSDDEGGYLVDNEGQVLAWLCGDQFSPQDSFFE
ncbi:hypothetical protein BGZ82_009719 [Podila clonocystis]|nr:hypothetical protein BGZ82_009719 [Podila clonocystis]